MAELSTSVGAWWRRLGDVAQPFGNREAQQRVLANSTPANRIVLAAAVFSLFASLGILTDISTLGRSTPARLLLQVLLSGGGALAYGWVIFTRPRWLPAVVVAHVGLTILSPRLVPLAAPLVTDDAQAAALASRLGLNVVLASLCIAAAYSLFIVFFLREGSRYYALRTELNLARTIHRELVPPIARSIGDYEFRGLSIPSGEVGGDLVDVVEHDDGAAWTAYVTDVSGHGVPSGVLMGMIKSAMRMVLVARVPLDAMLDRLNDVLYELKPPQMYATFAAIRHDGEEKLDFTLAGHLPVLRWRAASGQVDELTVGQVPLGILPGRTFEASTCQCEPGDVLLLLTDGITEVFDARDEEFGFERVKTVLATHAREPLEGLERHLLAAARAHGTPHDDQSLILIRRLA